MPKLFLFNLLTRILTFCQQKTGETIRFTKKQTGVMPYKFVELTIPPFRTQRQEHFRQAIFHKKKITPFRLMKKQSTSNEPGNTFILNLNEGMVRLFATHC